MTREFLFHATPLRWQWPPLSTHPKVLLLTEIITLTLTKRTLKVASFRPDIQVTFKVYLHFFALIRMDQSRIGAVAVCGVNHDTVLMMLTDLGTRYEPKWPGWWKCNQLLLAGERNESASSDDWNVGAGAFSSANLRVAATWTLDSINLPPFSCFSFI